MTSKKYDFSGKVALITGKAYFSFNTGYFNHFNSFFSLIFLIYNIMYYPKKTNKQ